MRSKPKYEFEIEVAQREDGWFVITVPEFPTVTTQAATLNDVQPIARHLIAQWIECNPDLVTVEVIGNFKQF